MLLLGSKLANYPVMSLQVGSEIARTEYPIIDPKKLKIIAYHLQGPLIHKNPENTLTVDDIRELSSLGFIIDSIDDLVDPSDIIRLSEVIDLNFHLIDHRVETKKGKKLGKVTDYTIDSATFTIFQLIVKRPLMQSLNDSELTINRSQIVEVDDERIIIKHDTETVELGALETNDFNSGYINPFRKHEVPAEPTETE